MSDKNTEEEKWGIDKIVDRLLSLFDSLTKQYTDLNQKCSSLIEHTKSNNNPEEFKEIKKEIQEFKMVLSNSSSSMRRIETLINELQEWKIETKKLPQDVHSALQLLKEKVQVLEKLDNDFFINFDKIRTLSIKLPDNFGQQLDKVATLASLFSKPLTFVSMVIGFVTACSGVVFAAYKLIILFSGHGSP